MKLKSEKTLFKKKKKNRRARVWEREGNPGKIGWTFLQATVYIIIAIHTPSEHTCSPLPSKL